MKTKLLIMLVLFSHLICYAQKYINADNIRICYETGRGGSFIGGQDHCITIWHEDSLIFCKRICYSISNNIAKYSGEYSLQAISHYYQEKGILLDLDTEESKKQAVLRYYQENGLEGLDYNDFRKKAILRHYQENNNFLILDERVEISKFQFDELIIIINEIKAFVSEGGVRSDGTIIISTGGSNHYMIKDEHGTAIIVDWLGRYNRRRDIEKALGLTSYLRCPCLEEDLKQMGYNRKNVPFWRRIFRRSYQ